MPASVAPGHRPSHNREVHRLRERERSSPLLRSTSPAAGADPLIDRYNRTSATLSGWPSTRSAPCSTGLSRDDCSYRSLPHRHGRRQGQQRFRRLSGEPWRAELCESLGIWPRNWSSAVRDGALPRRFAEHHRPRRGRQDDGADRHAALRGTRRPTRRAAIHQDAKERFAPRFGAPRARAPGRRSPLRLQPRAPRDQQDPRRDREPRLPITARSPRASAPDWKSTSRCSRKSRRRSAAQGGPTS